ncbi:hypothetical protein [Singulisphaera acidiphila]|uniref:hypothetical protein n=1 Tax=Singulisphaera acidiphila TaxID=466153 RepID=UPI0012FC7515|nr:hypothetical protein [Singulisphaera acidiphila]
MATVRHAKGMEGSSILGMVFEHLPGWVPRDRGSQEQPGQFGAPDRQAHRLAQPAGILDQHFDAASGSVTTAAPALRRRRTVPVGHQERVR